MIRKHFVATLFLLSVVAAAHTGIAAPAASAAPAAASEQYCGKLAQIGASAWRTRKDGYPMEHVLNEVNTILRARPETLEDAHEVIVAIYGDQSVGSAQQAYAKVFQDCRE